MQTDQSKTKAYLGLAAICLIWGTTYTAIKFAVRDFPPFMLVGIRQTSAGLLLLMWVFMNGQATWPSRQYLTKQGLTGLATITGGNGFITWGMQYVSSGLSSVIGSLSPVMVVLINLLWKGNEKINWLIITGVLMGFGGLGLIFQEGWKDFSNPTYSMGLFACFTSCVTWSLGTVMSKRFNDPNVSPMLNAGLQITAGGIGASILSLFLDKNHLINHTYQGWFSLIYLCLIGSALAFSIYMYVLKHLSTTVSSLYTYINPIVAILLGAMLLGEKLTWIEAIGMSVTLGGVYLVNKGNKVVSKTTAV